jgi:hypothetical protein
MYVQGTFSASLGGFTPSVSGARMTPLSVSTSDSSGTLPTGAVVVVTNVGTTNPMYCNVNGVAATTSDQLINPGNWFPFTIPSGVTVLHCIATGNSTTANGLGGAGLPTGAANDDAAILAAINNGVGATGAAAPADAILEGGDAQSSEPSKATTGNLAGAFYDLAGKQITSPYANRENYTRGAASETGTSAGTILPASGSASLKEYITAVQCGRTDAGTTAIYVTLNDTASTIIVLPNNGGGGGNNVEFPAPLAVAANTAATFTASSGVSTIYCSAQGYNGY